MKPFRCAVVAFGVMGVLAGVVVPSAGVTLNVTIRDFCGWGFGTAACPSGYAPNPDFENVRDVDDRGIVQSTLGGDGTPQFAGGSHPTLFGTDSPSPLGTLTTAQYFYHWYHDTPGYNQATVIPLAFTDKGGGVIEYNNATFFPIDGQLLGNEGQAHNYSFTAQLHTTFTYQSGQVFSFSGDDDVWVFINRALVIDLGGSHSTETAQVALDTLGLTPGRTYDFDLFFAENHTSGSDIRIDTSIPLTPNDTCGSGTVDPGEQCDLGTANCPVGQYCSSGCTSDCKVIGNCTGSQTACTTAAECPPGEGCCGNAIVETGEQCDDGNLRNGDCCSNTCQIEAVASCVPPADVCAGTFGPHLISNPTVRRTRLSKSRTSPGGLDKWSTTGQFSLQDGQTIDPDTELVGYVLSQNNGANQSTNLYTPVLDPAICPNGRCFVPRTNSQGVDLRWTFKRKATDPDIVGAPGWRSGRFLRTARQPNLVRFLLSGSKATIGTPQGLGNIRHVRQSIKIGDDCVTRLLDCAPNSAMTRFTCKEAHCGNGIKDRGEQCGEPSLPACAAGKVCDTCVCVTGP